MVDDIFAEGLLRVVFSGLRAIGRFLFEILIRVAAEFMFTVFFGLLGRAYGALLNVVHRVVHPRRLAHAVALSLLLCCGFAIGATAGLASKQSRHASQLAAGVMRHAP